MVTGHPRVVQPIFAPGPEPPQEAVPTAPQEAPLGP
jgi:hypothetical protein